MPVLNFTLPENTQSVSRPIIYDIIDQLQTLIKIDKSAKIFFPGDIQKMKQPNSTLDSEDRSPQLPNDKLLFIEVEENFSKDMLGTNAINQHEHMPIFLDPKLNVSIRPIYATTDVVINFKYRTFSKSEAERWHNEMWMKVNQLRDVILHDVSYHYLLPVAFVELLKVIHEYREATDGYNESFEEYLFSNATGRLTVISDLADKDTRLSVSEKQCRIVGLFDFDGLPEKTERDDSNATWTISFNYKFSYEKPVGAVIKYPIIVHNQLLPKKYVLFSDSAYNLDNIFKRYSSSISALSNFEIQDIAYKYFKKNKYIKLPSFDEFILDKNNIIPSTHTVFTALCSLDVEERKTLLNLSDLGTIVIDPRIMNFILVSEYPYICKLYGSIIQVSLYRNEYLASADTITCDSTGNIISKDKLDLRKEHRVRFSFVTDLSLLSKDALARLGLYPDILQIFIDEYKKLGYLNSVNKDICFRYLRNSISKSDYNLYLNRNNEEIIQFNTVMLSQIIALRWTEND